MRYTHRTASGKHKFQGGYSQTTWNRNTTLSRSFTFRGETFEANLDASGDLRLSTFRAMYAYRWGNEKFRIGPMADRNGELRLVPERLDPILRIELNLLEAFSKR